MDYAKRTRDGYSKSYCKIVPKAEEIELGARVCDTIKKTYFVDKDWVDCYRHVAEKFTAIKVIMRKLFPAMKELEMLEMISKYTKDDVEDAFSHLVGDYIPKVS